MVNKAYQLADIGEVRLTKRSNARTIRISVSNEGIIRVSLPSWTPYAAGMHFVQQQRHWIAQQLAERNTLLSHGQSIGKQHRLSFERSKTDNLATRLDRDKNARVLLPPGIYTNSPLAQDAARRVAQRALRAEAESVLPERLHSLAQLHGYKFSSVRVRQLKGRWGSCSSRGDITLSLYLMQLPWELIDYVLVHELTHTEILHHGPQFWQALEKRLPNARHLRRQIKNYRPAVS